MIDKLVYINQHELHIIYDNRPPVTLRSDENVLQLADWFFTKTPLNLTTFNTARSAEGEATCSIISEKVS